MSNTQALKRKFATISLLWRAEAYDRALAEVQALLESWPGNAHLHSIRAGLIQLVENPSQSLDDARQDLQRAADLDPGAPAALIELGHFLDNVDDDPRAAAKAYAEGVANARRLLIDGLIGQAKAYRQLDKREEFLRCLREVLALTRFEGSAQRGRAGGGPEDVVVEWPTGQIYVLQLEGPYAEQIRELLRVPIEGRSA